MDNIIILIAFLPLIIVISLGIFLFLYSRDIEIIIKKAFKKALKEFYKEVNSYEHN